MTRLLTVELHRFLARRLVVLTMLGALLASGLVLLGAWQSSQPMSEQEIAEAEQLYEQELKWWEENGEQIVADCLEAEADEAEATGEDVDFECESSGPPQREWYIWTAPPLEDTFGSYLAAYAQVLMFAGLLVGATFTAAELSTGAMSTWLSFEPRRVRVYGSKVVAAALGVVPLAVAGIGVVVAGVYLIGNHFGLAGGMGAREWGDIAGTAVRSAGLTVVAGLAGAALGILLRHTAAVLGLAVVYLIGEQMLRALVPSTSPWVLGPNIEGWLLHGTVYYAEECTTDASGTMCDFTEHAITFGHSATYLLVAAVLVVLLGAAVFRTRDAA